MSKDHTVGLSNINLTTSFIKYEDNRTEIVNGFCKQLDFMSESQLFT